MTTTQPTVTIYTDGGARPNPGPGGYGVLMIYEDREVELSGGALETTNNQMELMAAITALESLDTAHRVVLYTDSTYVRKGITEWLAAWERSGWMNSKKEPVANQELWQRLQVAEQRHAVTWRWVRGHAGNIYNERVDRLATAARREITEETDTPEKTETTPAATGDIAVYVTGHYSYDIKAAGWGALIIEKGQQRELGGGSDVTSDNQAVLEAAIHALESLDSPGSVDVFTNSEYLQKGMTSWVKGWIKNQWKTAKGKPVQNRELWERLTKAAKGRKIQWYYVRVSDPNLQIAGRQASRHMRW
jgi:ribonuclease HI